MATATATAPTPALTPPPGVQSNFENPETIVPLSNIVVGVCIAVVTFFFLLRCYVRIFVRRTWIWEDVFASIAWAGTVCYCSAVASTMAHNGGRHLWDMTKAQSQQAGYWFSIATIFYGTAIPFTKLTILWLYRRVFVTKRWSFLDICIVGLAVLQGCFYLGTTLLKIFQCTPREKIWDKDLKGTCVDTATILNTSGIFNVTSDFLILFLPVYTILRLKMETKKKVMVLLVFTFGLCAPAFSVAGLVQRLRASANKDFTWMQPRIQFWGAAELTTGLLCFCLPELAILFRKRQPQKDYDYYPTDSYGKRVGSNAHQSGTQQSGTQRSRASQSMSEKRQTRPKAIRIESGAPITANDDLITPCSAGPVTPYSVSQLSPSLRSPPLSERYRPHGRAVHSHQSSVDRTGYFPRMSAERHMYDPLHTMTVKKEFTVEITEKNPQSGQLETRRVDPRQYEAEPSKAHVAEIHPTHAEPQLLEQRQPEYWGQERDQPQSKQPEAQLSEAEPPLTEQRHSQYWEQYMNPPQTTQTEEEVSEAEPTLTERPHYQGLAMNPPQVKQEEESSPEAEPAVTEQRRPSYWSQEMKQPQVNTPAAQSPEAEPKPADWPLTDQRRPSYWAQRIPSLGN